MFLKIFLPRSRDFSNENETKHDLTRLISIRRHLLQDVNAEKLKVDQIGSCLDSFSLKKARRNVKNAFIKIFRYRITHLILAFERRWCRDLQNILRT